MNSRVTVGRVLIGMVLALSPMLNSAESLSAGIKLDGSDNIEVLDQHSKRRLFYRDFIQGRRFVVNFIFTRCSASCPLASAVMQSVQQQLGHEAVNLVSLSMDPNTDRPERLQAYADKFHAEANWHFLTGTNTAFRQLLKKLGATATASETHGNLVIVGNDTGHRAVRLYGLPSANEVLAALDEVQ